MFCGCGWWWCYGCLCDCVGYFIIVNSIIWLVEVWLCGFDYYFKFRVLFGVTLCGRLCLLVCVLFAGFGVGDGLVWLVLIVCLCLLVAILLLIVCCCFVDWFWCDCYDYLSLLFDLLVCWFELLACFGVCVVMVVCLLWIVCVLL